MNEQLLELLACPICPTRPALKLKENLLVCKECGRGYRIIDDIPRLLPEDALSQEEVEDEIG
jgi:uncharacterized protein YbaR (Trm112 family)